MRRVAIGIASGYGETLEKGRGIRAPGIDHVVAVFAIVHEARAIITLKVTAEDCLIRGSIPGIWICCSKAGIPSVYINAADQLEGFTSVAQRDQCASVRPIHTLGYPYLYDIMAGVRRIIQGILEINIGVIPTHT